jgi:hypothetical protein
MLRLACLLLVLSGASAAEPAARPLIDQPIEPRKVPAKTDDSAVAVAVAAPPAGASAIVKGQLHVDGAPFFPVGMCQLWSKMCHRHVVNWAQRAPDSAAGPMHYTTVVRSRYVHSLTSADWDWMKGSGINTVLTYTNGLASEDGSLSNITAAKLALMGAFLDEAAARDMKVFFSLKDLYDTHNKGQDNAGIVNTIVTAFRNHKALLGWYLNDECLLWPVPHYNMQHE